MAPLFSISIGKDKKDITWTVKLNLNIKDQEVEINTTKLLFNIGFNLLLGKYTIFRKKKQINNNKVSFQIVFHKIEEPFYANINDLLLLINMMDTRLYNIQLIHNFEIRNDRIYCNKYTIDKKTPGVIDCLSCIHFLDCLFFILCNSRIKNLKCVICHERNLNFNSIVYLTTLKMAYPSHSFGLYCCSCYNTYIKKEVSSIF